MRQGSDLSLICNLGDVGQVTSSVKLNHSFIPCKLRLVMNEIRSQGTYHVPFPLLAFFFLSTPHGPSWLKVTGAELEPLEAPLISALLESDVPPLECYPLC